MPFQKGHTINTGKRNNPHGRPVIFPHKTARKIAGYVSQEGSKGFERARKRLAGLVGWPVGKVATQEVLEYLAIGHTAAVAIIQAKEKR